MLETCNCRNQYYRNRMQNVRTSCDSGCERKACAGRDIEGMPLAMAYVPWQHWKETYEPCKALSIGTIFPELNFPFLERSCCR